MKIVISGIGGVGGYFGGLLANHYRDSADVEVHFIARGENEKQIREQGLRMETCAGNFTVFPKTVSSQGTEAGIADLFICCTKTYDLEENIQQSRHCIGAHTIILPLHNGVDSRERIRKILPEQEVWSGCVYLVARLAAPGRLSETGNIRKLFFGSENGRLQQLQEVERIFKAAGIDATYSPDILATTWAKFFFISPLATATSYKDMCVGALLADAEGRGLIDRLLPEIKSVAEAMHIPLPEDCIAATLAKMAAIPYETKTSMHSDFQKGGKNELESLTGYIVRAAAEHGITVPVYEQLYEALKTRKKQ